MQSKNIKRSYTSAVPRQPGVLRRVLDFLLRKRNKKDDSGSIYPLR
jgi:hypothetical protein